MNWLIHTYGAVKVNDIKLIEFDLHNDSANIYAILNDNSKILIGYDKTCELCRTKLKEWLKEV